MNSNIIRLLARTSLVEDPYLLLDLASTLDANELSAEICKMPYGEFLETLYWQSVSIAVKERADNRCQVCNSPYSLEAHHRTYDIHGKEHLFLAEITCLDRACHGLFHRSKKKVVATRITKTGAKPRKGIHRFFRKAAIKLLISADQLNTMGRKEVKRLLYVRTQARLKKRADKKASRAARKAAFIAGLAKAPQLATT